jgi:hypothetical protein
MGNGHYCKFQMVHGVFLLMVFRKYTDLATSPNRKVLFQAPNVLVTLYPQQVLPASSANHLRSKLSKSLAITFFIYK